MQAAPVAAEAAAMIPRVILDMFGLACALCTVQVSTGNASAWEPLWVEEEMFVWWGAGTNASAET